MKHLLRSLLLVAATVAPLGAQTAATRPYHEPIAGYTVQVPAAWTPLPQSFVDGVAAQATGRTGGELPPSFGFQGERGENGVSGPLLFIRAVRDSAMRRTVFAAELTGATTGNDAAVEQGADVWGGSPVTRWKRVWDADAGVAWDRTSSTRADGIEVRTLNAVRPVDGWGMLSVTNVTGDGSSFEQMRERILRVVASLAVGGRPAEASLAGAQDTATRSYRDTVAGYTVQVPATWARLSTGRVNQILAVVTGRPGPVLPPPLGFEAMPGDAWPRVVMIVSAQRNPALRRAEFVRRTAGSGSADVAQGRDPLKEGHTSWDAGANVAWLAGSWTSATGGRERILLAARPVDRWGVLMVEAISSNGSSFEQIRQRMLPVLASLVVDDGPAPP